jgi:hypothetical protein
MFHRNRVILQMPLKVIHIYGDDSSFFFPTFLSITPQTDSNDLVIKSETNTWIIYISH